MTIKELKEKRAGLVNKMRALLDAAKTANRDLTADEQSTYDSYEKDVDSIGKQVDREERLAGVESALREQRDNGYHADLSDKPEKKGRFNAGYRDAFFGRGGFARVGRNGLTSNVLNVLTEGTDADGGYLVPEEFETELQKMLYNQDPIRAAATVITTAGDRNIPIQVGGSTFAWIGESGTYGTTGATFGKVVLSAYKLGGIVPISEELLQDSAFAIEPFISEDAAHAIDTLEQTAFCTGDGSAKPLGLFNTTSVAGVAIPTGVTGAASATAAITGDNLIDVYHALPTYHRSSATWLMADGAVKLIRKLKNATTGEYVWQPGLVAGQPDRILTRPVIVSDYATAPAVDAKSIVFGNLKKYYIVDRLGVAMQRLNELYAANGQVGFRFTKRVDARLIDPKAIVTFTHGAAS